MSGRFDLVISFQGSVSCSPALRTLIEEEYDDRFLFDTWNQPLMEKLWEQQNERLKNGLPYRNVLLIIDDITMDHKSREMFAHLCMRGRHIGISIIINCVSYTVIPKSSRRSLDYLFVFDLPMSGDKKVLLQEFTKNSSTAEFYLNRIPKYNSLVLKTMGKQELFYYKAKKPQSLEHDEFQSEFLLSDDSLLPRSPNKTICHHNSNTLNEYEDTEHETKT